jgi:hypothetical protein
MTVIVYRDGIMAGDTAEWASGCIVSHAHKVQKTKDGWIFGCSGINAEIVKFEKWMHAGRIAPALKLKEIDALVLAPDGKVYKFEDADVVDYSNVKFYVIGACCDFARGALHAGASAEETVKLCIENLAYAGGKCEVLSLTKPYSRGKHLPIVEKDTKRGG